MENIIIVNPNDFFICGIFLCFRYAIYNFLTIQIIL